MSVTPEVKQRCSGASRGGKNPSDDQTNHLRRKNARVSTDKPPTFICCHFPSAGGVTVLPLDPRPPLKLPLCFFFKPGGCCVREAVTLVAVREERGGGMDHWKGSAESTAPLSGGWVDTGGAGGGRRGGAGRATGPSICCSPIDLSVTFQFRRLHEVHKVSR